MKPLTFADRDFIPLKSPDAGNPGSLRAARLRIAITYTWRHRRVGNFDAPARFTEWVQWRKLNERDWRMPPLIDKVAVKRHVAHLLGSAFVTPTWFEGSDLRQSPTWSAPFVVKSRHGCQQHVFVREHPDDWRAIRRATERWTRNHYGFWLDEWAYGHVPRGILIEPFIGTENKLPTDYKIHLFGGKAACIQVHQDREVNHNICAYYDLDWNRLWMTPGWRDCPPPQSLPSMIVAAEALASDFDYVRADFYDIDGQARFGELTFYPASGLTPQDDAIDFWLGSLWSAARMERETKGRIYDRRLAHA